MKQKEKTMLGKRLQMYSGLKEMEEQFAKDVATIGLEFTAIAEENFDLTNPWDQMVMVAILTNMLACVEVQAEQDGVNLEKSMKVFYELNKEDYRKQVIEKVKK